MKSPRAGGPKWKNKQRSPIANTPVTPSGSPPFSPTNVTTGMENDTTPSSPVNSLGSLSSPVKTSSTGATYRTVVDMSGWVNKWQSRMPSSIRRFFRLSDSILYNQPQITSKPTWKLSISRANVRADYARNLIFLTCPVRNLRFSTATAAEAHRWLMALRAAALCNVNDFYTMGRTIGTGSFGTVREAVDKNTGAKRAIKIVHRTSNKTEREFVSREMSVLLTISHPNIVRTHDIFDERHRILVVMTFIPGGDLFDFIVKRGTLVERMAKHAVWQIITGIKYLHEHNIVHRDIKLENILVANDDPLQLQLTDFGFANYVNPATAKEGPVMNLNSMVGTGSYMAPEVIDGRGHGTPVDIFAAGVVMFRLLGGHMPFRAMSLQESYDLVQAEKADFASPQWQTISTPARVLCRSMLTAAPGKRPTAKQILEHEWFVDDQHFLQEAVTADETARKKQEKEMMKEQELYDKTYMEGGLNTDSSSNLSVASEGAIEKTTIREL